MVSSWVSQAGGDSTVHRNQLPLLLWHTPQWQGHSLASRVELVDGKQLTVLQNMGCSYYPELPDNLEKFPDRLASQGNLEEE